MPVFSVRSLVAVLVVVMAGSRPGCAQPDLRRVMVSDSLLRAHVYTLASDSLQGRRTGTIGQRKAAAYCLRALRTCHLFAPFQLDSSRLTYRQTFPIAFTNVATFGYNTNSVAGRTRVTAYSQAELLDEPLSRRDSSRALFGMNLGGVIPGSDLKQEIVVLSAHYDHLGASGNGVFHGADDNASGTAAVLSVAAIFDSLSRAGVHSRRSVLFVLFAGEEDGLLGSAYFITHSPIALDQIMGNLNADMVGRVDNAHKRDPDYCYILTNKQGAGLLQTAGRANDETVRLTLNQGGYDTVDDPEQSFRRSDQFNFARLGIPALFFTSGSHDDYHRTTDTARKIRYDLLQKRATLLFQTAWALANPSR